MNISISAEKIFEVMGLPITNSMVVAWIMMIVLVGCAYFATRRMERVPHGIQNLFEVVCDAILSLIDSVTGDRAQSRRFFPLIATIFLFVLAVNWAGLIPGAGSIGIYEVHDGHTVLVPFIRSSAADLNFTLALAIVSVIAAQVVGVMSIGFFKYAGKFFNFSSPLNFFVGILELISEVAKLISFSFRLFGNIFAGEVLLLVIAFLVPFIVPVPFLGMEVFVGLIQAVVFAMLTLVFMKMATIEAHH